MMMCKGIVFPNTSENETEYYYENSEDMLFFSFQLLRLWLTMNIFMGCTYTFWKKLPMNPFVYITFFILFPLCIIMEGDRKT